MAGAGFADRDFKWYQSWLRREDNYSRQSYKEVESILRTAGRNSLADRVAMESKDVEYERQPLYRRIMGALHKWTLGYGYRPEFVSFWR